MPLGGCWSTTFQIYFATHHCLNKFLEGKEKKSNGYVNLGSTICIWPKESGSVNEKHGVPISLNQCNASFKILHLGYVSESLTNVYQNWQQHLVTPCFPYYNFNYCTEPMLVVSFTIFSFKPNHNFNHCSKSMLVVSLTSQV